MVNTELLRALLAFRLHLGRILEHLDAFQLVPDEFLDVLLEATLSWRETVLVIADANIHAAVAV